MEQKEWVYKEFERELSISIPKRNATDIINSNIKKDDDEFIGYLFQAKNGVMIKFSQKQYGNDLFGNKKLDDLFYIRLPFQKARELAKWLLETTEDIT